MQGRSNQQATSGKGGMKDLQDKLMQLGTTAATKVNGLTTTQKVIGGSLLALGAGWLAMNSNNKNQMKNKLGSAAAKAQKKMNKLNKKQKNSGSPSGSYADSTSGISSASTNARVK